MMALCVDAWLDRHVAPLLATNVSIGRLTP